MTEISYLMYIRACIPALAGGFFYKIYSLLQGALTIDSCPVKRIIHATLLRLIRLINFMHDA
ncbi:hypothetical protein DESHY_70005 [Desulforamulus hydrothermalis Lam5 = DSM 18033]|uniref:Uncharacterized protein n=1 Tax=Desulforamulus hydrothermalis Lam5 = DSM 18033 TaxID=1121428 RepID=K8E0R4_9FIRM|nr:hypothetical protein DESHY_70005 [Desulforamulus hydrothermalis Lam5 = DSM 18033]